MKTPHLAALLGLAAAVACTEATGPGSGPDNPGDGLGFVEIGMVRSGSPSLAAVAGSLSFSVDGATAPLDPANIQSLTVQVISIQVHAIGEEDGENGDGAPGGWMDVELAEPVELDLLALPTEGDSPLMIAAGAVAAGNYSGVRLFLGGASMTLNESVTVGQALYEGGVPLDVWVPSAEHTGIKTDLAFTVSDGEEPSPVNLLFDPTATFANVNLTGNGNVILAPVIRAHGTDEDDEGGS